MTIEERALILNLIETDPEMLAAFKLACQDPDTGDAYFINVVGVTFDPRNGPDNRPIGAVPFLLWKEQEEVARRIGAAIDGGYDLPQEKPRDKGLTWLNLYLLLKRWILVDGVSFLIGSYTEDLLDNKKARATLGWKLDFAIEHLPACLQPKGFNPERRGWATWQNPQNGNTIEGRAPTDRFAVGDRKTAIYFDDFGQWEMGASAWENASATSNCRLASWTVNREKPLNHVYDLRFGVGRFEGVQFRDMITVQDIPWFSDPRKQRTAIDPDNGKEYNVWYREQVGDAEKGIGGKITMEQFQRDYEGLYEIKAKGIIYAEQLPYVRVGTFPYDPRFPLNTTTDYGVDDDCAIVWIQWDWESKRFRFVSEYVNHGHGIRFYYPMLLGKKDPGEILPMEASYDEDDRRAISLRTSWQIPMRDNKNGAIVHRVPYRQHFGDPAVKQRSQTDGRSVSTLLDEECGIQITVKETNKARSHFGRIEALRQLLLRSDIDRENCPKLISALQKYQWNKTQTAPVHDGASHIASAAEFFAVNNPHHDEIEDAMRPASQEDAKMRLQGVFGDASMLPESRERQKYPLFPYEDDETPSKGRKLY